LDRIYKRKRKSSAKVPAVSSFDDHTALRVKKNNCKGFAERCATSPWASHSFARSVCGLGVTSCLVTRSNQETRQDVPSWISLRLPLFKGNSGERQKILKFISRRLATTSGRRRK
jgi:hypothetical protein